MKDISLVNIKKNYGFKNVLDGFNLDVNKRKKIGLIGENGCGDKEKTLVGNKCTFKEHVEATPNFTCEKEI